MSSKEEDQCLSITHEGHSLKSHSWLGTVVLQKKRVGGSLTLTPCGYSMMPAANHSCTLLLSHQLRAAEILAERHVSRGSSLRSSLCISDPDYGCASLGCDVSVQARLCGVCSRPWLRQLWAKLWSVHHGLAILDHHKEQRSCHSQGHQRRLEQCHHHTVVCSTLFSASHGTSVHATLEPLH